MNYRESFEKRNVIPDDLIWDEDKRDYCWKAYPGVKANQAINDAWSSWCDAWEEVEGVVECLNTKLLELQKDNLDLRYKLNELVKASQANTGAEPSLSCFYRTLEESQTKLDPAIEKLLIDNLDILY
jgi:hypothetical protein